MNPGAFLTGLRWDALPPAVKRQTQRCLKDIIGTAAGSLALPAAQGIESLVAAQFGQGPAPMFFRGPRTTLAGASFGNALRIDGLDCHDGFRPNKGHAGATVVPVALAAAAITHPSGAVLLGAVCAGYEIALRAGLALHPLYAPAYHASGSWAAIGAAAAGALLMGVPAARIDEVLGIAEYYGPVSPMLRCTVHPSIVKDGAGAGAWAAAMALAMHAQGMTGLPSLFTDEPLGRAQMVTLGTDWVMLRQYFKLYPTCRWTHAPVEGVLRLQAQYRFKAGEVKRVDVESFSETSTLMTFPPKDSDGAQYCLPWALAAVLVDGVLGVDQVVPPRLADREIISLGEKVAFVSAPDLDARFPQECLARVTVHLDDGRVLAGPTLGARGDYNDPASDRELDEKFARLATPGLGVETTRRLATVIETLDERPASDLLEILAQGGLA